MGAQDLSSIIEERLAASPTDQCVWWREAFWSRGALAEMIGAAASSLASSGVRRGDAIALVMNNGPDMLALCCAAWRIGAIVVPISPTLKPSAAIECVRSTGAVCAIVGDDTANRRADLEAAGTPCAVVSDLEDGALKTIRRDDVAHADGTAVIFRILRRGAYSHTVPLTHSNIISLLDAVRGSIGPLNDDDIVLNSVSNCTALGLVICGVLPLAAGCAQVILSSLTSPEHIAQQMRKTRVTVVPIVTRMLSMMLEDSEITPFTHVRLLFCGGGDLSTHEERRAREVFGTIPLEAWGLTETSGVFAITPPGDERPGSNGKVLSCFEVETRGGRLFTRGPAVSSACVGEDGWLDTGMTAAVDDDGYITIFK